MIHHWNLRILALASLCLISGCASVHRAVDPLTLEKVQLPLSIVTEGIEVFYETVERLKRDEEAADELWSTLYSAPGYSLMEAEENRSAWMNEWIEVAYRPSLQNKLEEHSQQKDLIGILVLPNLALAVEQQATIYAMIDELAKPGTHAEILDLVKSWLPDGALELRSIPLLYMVIMDGDSKAFEAGIVLDAVALAMCGTDYAKRLIAHEFHHHYRRAYDVLEIDEVPALVRPLVNLMERAETEGIADLIDKRDLIFAPNGIPATQLAHPLLAWMWKKYLPLFDLAPEHMAELNLLLEQVASGALDPERARLLETQAGQIGARPFGIFIANAIEQALGREKVISCIGDPFALFLAYAEASTGDDALPKLSDKACAGLRQLQAAYVFKD